MQKLWGKKKNQHIAKMWLIYSACFPFQLIRKLYYRKVKVAFLSKGNVQVSEKWDKECQELLHHHFHPTLSGSADACPTGRPVELICEMVWLVLGP